MAEFKRLYALYRGEEFVMIGTANELAERIGVSVQRIRHKSTPSYHKVFDNEKSTAYITFKMDEDDCE